MRTNHQPLTRDQAEQLREAIRGSGLPVATVGSLAGVDRVALERFLAGRALRPALVARVLGVNAVRRGLGLEVSR